jgi:hypothetical protein
MASSKAKNASRSQLHDESVGTTAS